MDDDSLQSLKADLRQAQRLSRRGRDSVERHRASQAVTGHLVSELRDQRYLRVAAFMAVRGELDLESMPELLPTISWYLPKVIQRDGPLSFGVWDARSLAPGAFGIMEPGGELVDVHALDAVLVPGLGFTLAGDRLGMGGGFYDRTLNGYGGRVIGVAYDEEVLEEIPSGPHDRRVDCLVSPSGWHDCH